MTAQGCWPSDTKAFSKGKNQADAAAGELRAQAGLGKQLMARWAAPRLLLSVRCWRREPRERIS